MCQGQSIAGPRRPRNPFLDLIEYLQPLLTELLFAIAKGEVDTQAIAARAMADRGVDQAGKGVGFAAAVRDGGDLAELMEQDLSGLDFLSLSIRDVKWFT